MAALRASYHRILDRVEHMLPAKLRPLYNHPAGNVSHPASRLADLALVAGDRCGLSPAAVHGGGDVDVLSRRGKNSSCLSMKAEPYESHCFNVTVLLWETLICLDNTS